MPAPESLPARAAVRIGALPADGKPRSPARRLTSLEPLPSSGNRAFKIARRAAFAAATVGAGVGTLLAFERIGLRPIAHALVDSQPVWVLVALALMCLSMLWRAVAWWAILRAALPEALPRLVDAIQGTTIGVLMSATLPARLGEPSRALVVARRLGRPRDRLPAVLGTIVSQTLLNVLALVILGIVMFTTIGLFARPSAGPRLVRAGAARRAVRRARGAGAAALRPAVALDTRAPLDVAGRARRSPACARAWPCSARRGSAPRRSRCSSAPGRCSGSPATCCSPRSGSHLDMGAAAAVLFAVNVTAVLPLTPSNLGVFQAACLAVLTGAYGVDAAQALGYGIILQAVEIATAVVMGAPALVKEGLSWREVRLRAMHSAPVSLGPLPRGREPRRVLIRTFDVTGRRRPAPAGTRQDVPPYASACRRGAAGIHPGDAEPR